MQLLMPTEAEIAWAAGFFEGEGYFSSIKRQLLHGAPRQYPYVGINNTDYAMLLRFQAIVGCGKIKPRNAPYGRKKQWRWIASKRAEAEHVRDLLWPWLSERRREYALTLFDERGCLLGGRERAA
jgi:hypothetical protein